MKLQDRLPDSVTVNGKRYRLDLDFRNVLRMMVILGRDDLMPDARKYLALKCVMKHPPRDIGPVLDATRKMLFPESPHGGERLTSFEQDAGMIRAAFRQAYGIDLYRERLHWIEFTELLNSLPEGSRYAEVLGIRARPIPPATKYNQKEREWLIRAKAACAIHMTEDEQEKNYQAGVSKLFSGLMRMIEKAEAAEKAEKPGPATSTAAPDPAEITRGETDGS